MYTYVYVYMYMHASFGSVIFSLGHCFKFSSATVLARSLHFGFFPAKEKFPGTQMNPGTSTKQEIPLQS